MKYEGLLEGLKRLIREKINMIPKKFFVLAVISLVLLVTGCSRQTIEKGVGAKLRESQGKKPQAYTEIIDSNLKSLEEMKNKASDEPGAVAMELVGMAKGIELRFENDNSPVAKAIVRVFKDAANKIEPSNAGNVIDETIVKLKKLR